SLVIIVTQDMFIKNYESGRKEIPALRKQISINSEMGKEGKMSWGGGEKEWELDEKKQFI
ncbi:hypothetical protein CEXT_689131, partial [Caerostris extrusa]